MKNAILTIMTMGFLFGQVDYSSQIQTILNDNCTSCHTYGHSSGLDLTNYSSVINGGNSGAVIIPGDHANSILWQKINSGAMPPNGTISSTQINLIADWIDEGALEDPAVDVAGLFFSEYGEGSSNNKYLEIYNGTGSVLDLTEFAFPNVSNAPSTSGEYEYWNEFPAGATVAAGDVYVIANPSADAVILAFADYEFQYLSNGNDGFCLVEGTESSFIIVDCIGDWNGDPGDGWDVAGVVEATKDHTLVRKANVTEGNGGDWPSSAGTDASSSEWVVLDQDTWDYLGSHPHEFADPIPEIVINEFLASNDVCCLDENGENDDFIEIYNYGTEPVDIGGMYITDDLADPTIWQIPTTASDSTTIQPGGFLLLWADKESEQGVLHVEIKLSGSGEQIGLFTINGTVVDSLTFGEQTTDVSYGRIPDGSNTWEYFESPTPGVSNEPLLDFTAIYDIQYVVDSDADDASPLYGQEVTITGVVTAEFWGSDQSRYMHVQDSEGPWNGIVAFNYGGWDSFDFVDDSGAPIVGPAEGDSVTLTGTVEEYYNLTELIDISVGVVHGPATNIIEPTVVTIGEIGEAYEGCLIEVNNVTISDADLGYGEWEFSDGTNSSTSDDKWNYYYYPEADQNLGSIVGVLDYNYSNYKLQPRLARDVVEASGDPVRIQRVQQVLYSDLMKAGMDEESDMSYMSEQTVTLEGIVTMPTGLSFAGSGVKFIFADVNGGPWSAILSYDPDSSAFPTLFEGDLIQATGYISEYTTSAANMTELFITEPVNIIDFELATPPVDTVNTGDLRWPTEAEQWGNVIVRIEDGVVTENDLNYEVFAVDDGTGAVLVDDDSDSIGVYFNEIGPPPVGSLAQSIEGWVYHHYGSYTDSTTYKLCPLYPEDIVFGAGPPSIRDLSRNPCAPTSSDSEVAVSCLITDNSFIAEALVHYSINGGNYMTVAMSTTDDSTFTGVIPVSNGDNVSYYITATDDGADQSEPKSSMFPNDIAFDQFGFNVTDELTIDLVQSTQWPSGNTLYEGCEVTLTGIVTADTSQYSSGYSSYAFQDGTGQWSGLVFDTEELVELTRGYEVTVSGLITDYDPEWGFKFNGNTRLINSDVSVLSSGNDVPTPTIASCGDLSQMAEEVESYEGVLVKIDNVTISSVGQHDWSITDASGAETLIDDDMANMAADNFMSELTEGQELDHVMGIFNFSFGTYKLQIRDLADLGGTVGIDDNVQVNPYEFALHDNFPNPFNPETQIRFSMGGQENVKLVIYDIMGRQVRALINGESYRPGFHVVNWDGLDNAGQQVSTGMYIYRIKAGDFIEDKKMLLVK